MDTVVFAEIEMVLVAVVKNNVFYIVRVDEIRLLFMKSRFRK